MNLAQLSIKRPAFITCIVIMMLALGVLSLNKLGVDLFPDVTFPIVTVTTVYPGAGPQEMETQVSKVIEDELSSIAGVKSVSSINKEGVSAVITEFALETDVKFAEQQVKDRVAAVKRKLPEDVDDPVIRRIDPGDQPIMIISLTSDLPAAQLYDLANETIRPQLEQVKSVGLVEVLGGREREIRIELDRNKLKSHEVSASQVAARLGATGQNIPAGKISNNKSETVYRTLGEFRNINDIRNTIVNFIGNDVPVKIEDLGKVIDSLQDEKSKTFVNGQQALFIMVFRQSGANTIAVTDAVRTKIATLNETYSKGETKAELTVLRDLSKFIRANVQDVKESIFFGIVLTIIVVFFFLGNGRSTLITGAALPNSLLGAFILMAFAGFTINVMTLLALSLAVGLLVDDAIVVRENIFRHQEMGKSPSLAALIGTREVTLAVVATTLTVLAVFGPIGFLSGVVGQFFKQFGLTICFAMLISLFDALTIAPMLSAYFPAKVKSHGGSGKKTGFFHKMTAPVRAFDRFQNWLEEKYEKVLRFSIRRPFITLASALGIFILSLVAAKYVPKTFLPAQDMGEFSVGLDMPPGTSLEAMTVMAKQVDEKIRSNKEVKISTAIVGNRDGEANVTEFFVELVPRGERAMNTTVFKEVMRTQLKEFAIANPKVKDIDMVSGGMRPFNVSIQGNDLEEVRVAAQAAFEKLRVHPGLKDVEISDKPGKPEFQVALDPVKADRFGISTSSVGRELRAQVEGVVPALYRENAKDYDIRIRMIDDQRNLERDFAQIYVPNINGSLVRLSSIAHPVKTTGPANISRRDRGRYINIGADVAPDGPGLGAVMTDIQTMFEKDIKLPPGVSYRFVGQAENFAELVTSMVVAMGLGILFIYLVLASLYESFVTPLTIMLVLPLAACGAFYGLFITGKSLDMFSMIGCVMLLGIATKNSILLVDKAKQLTDQGKDRTMAMILAGRNRLRPILMTSFALIAGMLPVAIGLNEASRQRTSMGVAVIGGLITSTILTLVVVPAAYSFIDRFREWSLRRARRLAGLAEVDNEDIDALEASLEKSPVYSGNGHQPSV
ncbi:MAG: efflux RND transporter permease subunit [Bdellovibrionales bacterium]